MPPKVSGCFYDFQSEILRLSTLFASMGHYEVSDYQIKVLVGLKDLSRLRYIRSGHYFKAFSFKRRNKTQTDYFYIVINEQDCLFVIGIDLGRQGLKCSLVC